MRTWRNVKKKKGGYRKKITDKADIGKTVKRAKSVEDADGITSLTTDFREPGMSEMPFDLVPPGLEELAVELTEEHKKFIAVFLTDFFGAEERSEKEVFKNLRNACARAGMLEKKGDQVKFFHMLADPKLQWVSRKCAQGVISTALIPVMMKVTSQAIDGDKKSQEWVLEMSEMIKSKYQFYLDRRQQISGDVSIDASHNLNVDGMDDKELDAAFAELTDVTEAEEAIS